MEKFNARLYLVDISGYTNFLTRTSLLHARETIAEILERLNELTGKDIELSKIEGDALFFYTTEKTTEGLVEISKDLQEEFFRIIEELEQKHSQCDFPICHNLSNLDLKFFINKGEIAMHEIGGFSELIGKPVVETHRLLKNDLEEDSYILIVKEDGEKSVSYPTIGEITYDLKILPDKQ